MSRTDAKVSCYSSRRRCYGLSATYLHHGVLLHTPLLRNARYSPAVSPYQTGEWALPPLGAAAAERRSASIYAGCATIHGGNADIAVLKMLPFGGAR
eukprot:1482161-Rhodomonas_salina.1